MKKMKKCFAVCLLIMWILPFSSCTKDTDLFLAAVLQEELESVEKIENEETTENTDTDTDTNTDNTNKVDDFITCTAGAGSTYNPASAAEIQNIENAGRTAVITNTFDCTGCTFASGQTIVPSGGVISGTDINVNGACVIDDFSQLFTSTVIFSTTYKNSRLSPETFGAVSGDATDDTDAIDALINNSEYATAVLNGSYIKNQPSDYKRTGIFDWNMNGASVSVTSRAGFNVNVVTDEYMFDITNLSPSIYNGEFDGTDTYGRLFFLHGQPNYSFRNLYVHNLFATKTYRCVAFKFSARINSSGFVSGEFKDNLIEDIFATGDGNYNNSPAGIAKAWWYTLSDVDATTSFSIVHQNNVVRNIVGDDAEAFYAIQNGGTLTHNGTFLFDNEDYRYCTRRAIKACVSNITVQNSFFEEIPGYLYTSAQQMGTMLDFFSTQSVNLIQNITVNNNTIKTVDGEKGHYHLISLTEVDGANITNNTIEMDNLENYAGVRLGSGTSTYTGILKNINITGNSFKNTGVQMLTYYSPQDQINVSGNTFNYTYDTTDSWGQQQAALRTTNTSGTKGNIDFLNNDIIVNVPNSTSLFNGVIWSNGADITNVLIENVTMTYQNAGVTRPFAYLKGNFNNTNTIQNCTLTGDNGINSIEVVGGTQSVRVINSSDDSGNPITIK